MEATWKKYKTGSPCDTAGGDYTTVDGSLMLTNKLEIVAPYLTLIGLVGTIVVVATTLRRHRA